MFDFVLFFSFPCTVQIQTMITSSCRNKFLLLAKGRMEQRYSSNLVISDEVKAALKAKLPVVALESTIISHGMPYPRNLEVANLVEDMVRANGAVPATVAVINGVFKVGLSKEDLQILAQPPTPPNKVYKASRRDLAFLANSRANAGTTVAGTMILAARAGSDAVCIYRCAKHSVYVNLFRYSSVCNWWNWRCSPRC